MSRLKEKMVLQAVEHGYCTPKTICEKNGSIITISEIGYYLDKLIKSGKVIRSQVKNKTIYKIRE